MVSLRKNTLSSLYLPLYGQYNKDQEHIMARDAKKCADFRMTVKIGAQKALTRIRILQCLPKKNVSSMGWSKKWNWESRS